MKINESEVSYDLYSVYEDTIYFLCRICIDIEAGANVNSQVYDDCIVEW